MRIFILSLLSVVFFMPLGAAAQESDTDKIAAFLAGQVAEDDPGLAVGVMKNGEIITEYYSGLADLSYGIPVNEKTRFNLASNAKQFTALHIQSLIAKGQLSLDDDIRTYVPEVYTGLETPITVRHLLTHTSGIRDVYDLWGLQGVTWWREFIGNDDALALLSAQRELNFAPGSDYLYSNSNYILLATIAERICENRFRNLTGEMFDAMDMRSTRFVRRYGAVIPDQAKPYGNFGWWFAYPMVTELYGDGFLYSTLPDQLRFEAHVQAGDDPLIRAIQAPIPAAATQDYGYGLEFGDYKGVPYRYHYGSTGAFNSALLRFEYPDISIIVMSNNATVGTSAIASAIADIMLEGRITEDAAQDSPVVTGPRPDANSVTGLYRGQSGTVIAVTEKGGKLYREIAGTDPAELLHEDGNVFVYSTNENLRMAFEPGVSGPRTPVIYFPGQTPNPLTRVTAAPDSADYRGRFTGLFYNEELDMTFEISTDAAGTLTARRGARDFDVDARIANILSIGPYRLRALGDVDQRGPIQTLYLDGDRITNVRFERLE